MSFIKSNLELEIEKNRRDSIYSFWSKISFAGLFSRKGRFLGFDTQKICDALLALQKNVGSKEPFWPGGLWPHGLKRRHISRAFDQLYSSVVMTEEDGIRTYKHACGCTEATEGGWGWNNQLCDYHQKIDWCWF